MVNHVFLEGNLVSNVNVKQINENLKVGEVALAVDDRVGPKKPKTTSFFDLEAWGNVCDVLSQNCTKGSRVMVVGRLKQEQFTSKKDEKKIVKTKIIVEKVFVVSSTTMPQTL